MSKKEEVCALIDDLVLTALNNSAVTDITDRKEIKTKFRVIEEKKEEVVKNLMAILINQ